MTSEVARRPAGQDATTRTLFGPRNSPYWRPGRRVDLAHPGAISMINSGEIGQGPGGNPAVSHGHAHVQPSWFTVTEVGQVERSVVGSYGLRG